MLFAAKQMGTALGNDYGVNINLNGFIGLFLNPLQTAGETVQVVLNSLLDQTKNEIRTLNEVMEAIKDEKKIRIKSRKITKSRNN